MNTEIKSRVESIVKLLDEKKGEEIEVFDLEDSDYIAKAVILVNSLGGKHTSALFDHIRENKKELGEHILGFDESDEWIVVDLEDILIHIMTPQYRMRYSLEEFLQELKDGAFKPQEEL
jgi:ribosome silencing factor RsfS/YbeB/iojap